MKINKIKLKKQLSDISKKLNLPELLAKFTQQADKIIADRNKLVLAIALILVILYLDFSFGLGSQRRAFRAINPKIVRLRSDLRNLDLDLNRMQREESGLGISQAKRIALADQVSWLIEEISRLASQQKVRIFQIKPLRGVPLATAARRTAQRSSPAEGSPMLIDLDISAGYHQLGRFLAKLENHPVFLEVNELNIQPDSQSSLEHQVKLKLKTYVSENK
jgi:Tfp pilus assembly protein PilO